MMCEPCFTSGLGRLADQRGAPGRLSAQPRTTGPTSLRLPVTCLDVSCHLSVLSELSFLSSCPSSELVSAVPAEHPPPSPQSQAWLAALCPRACPAQPCAHVPTDEPASLCVEAQWVRMVVGRGREPDGLWWGFLPPSPLGGLWAGLPLTQTAPDKQPSSWDRWPAHTSSLPRPPSLPDSGSLCRRPMVFMFRFHIPLDSTQGSFKSRAPCRQSRN